MKSKRGEGSILLKQIIEYSKQQGYSRLWLHAINEKRLLEWYLSHGFKIVETIYEGADIKAIKFSIDL